MEWVVVALAILVLGVGALAATGRFDALKDPVNDRPKGRIPDGPIDERFVAEVRFPIVRTGYRTAEVDEHFDQLVAGTAEKDVRFHVVRNGYDMAVVDDILDRWEAEQAKADSTPVVDEPAPPDYPALEADEEKLQPASHQAFQSPDPPIEDDADPAPRSTRVTDSGDPTAQLNKDAE